MGSLAIRQAIPIHQANLMLKPAFMALSTPLRALLWPFSPQWNLIGYFPFCSSTRIPHHHREPTENKPTHKENIAKTENCQFLHFFRFCKCFVFCFFEQKGNSHRTLCGLTTCKALQSSVRPSRTTSHRLESPYYSLWGHVCYSSIENLPGPPVFLW